MAGYILPPTLTCANLTYYDYATGAAGGARGRLAWLQRMVSCVCPSPYMQLPFGVCDASNKGICGSLRCPLFRSADALSLDPLMPVLLSRLPRLQRGGVPRGLWDAAMLGVRKVVPPRSLQHLYGSLFRSTLMPHF